MYFVRMKNSSHRIMLKAGIFFLIFFAGMGKQKAFGFVEIGYRVGLWLNTGGINSIIREYNTQNPWQQFKPMHLGLGGRTVWGIQRENVSYLVGLKWLRNTQTASGTDPATQANNTKRLVVHYGGIVMGVQTNIEGAFNAGIELNAFNYYVLRYQESTTSNVKAGTDTEIVNDPNPGISLFVRIALQHGIAGVTLIPAFDMSLVNGKNDISGLRSKWKLYTPSEPQMMRGYNLSLTLSVLLGKKRD